MNLSLKDFQAKDLGWVGIGVGHCCNGGLLTVRFKGLTPNYLIRNPGWGPFPFIPFSKFNPFYFNGLVKAKIP